MSRGRPLAARIGASVGALLCAVPALAAPVDAGRCAGYPRVALNVPSGWCVGRVADAGDGLRMPRRVLEVAPGRLWITDMGSWERGRGRLLELRVDGSASGAARVRVLASGLDRPHGLQRGPDGRIYVGEAGGIWRTPVDQPLRREDLIAGLPAEGSHPLKELAFGDGGRLYLNVGSSSDACRDEHQQPRQPCPDSLGPRPRAAVYEARLGGAGQTLQSLRPYATGLRNSLGLAVLPGGTVWQAENSVDYADTSMPAEELNALVDGGRYGWPACVSDASGRSVPARGWEGAAARADCARQRAPVQAWPAHVAPLQLLWVPPAASAAAARPWSGRLLAVWHGYRPGGHRVVAWRLGAEGRPTGPREDLVSGWDAVPGRQPLGTPAGITVDSAGRLWMVEDRNRTLLVVAPDAAVP